jgi:hypothetical protein
MKELRKLLKIAKISESSYSRRNRSFKLGAAIVTAPKLSSICDVELIESSSLTLDQCPNHNSTWEEKMMFALTFDGYEFHGSTLACAEIANTWKEKMTLALSFDGYEFHGSTLACAEIASTRRHGLLDELRTCLFFEQRYIRNNGQSRLAPNVNETAYVSMLISLIRVEVTKAGS